MYIINFKAMDHIVNILESLLEPIGVLLIVFVLLLLNSWIFKRLKSEVSDRNIIKKSISFLLIFVGILVFILSFPIDKSLKGQILSFLAIIISAGVALSSTTILGNLIAGIMNNSMNRFRNGDLIKIGDLQGRVTKKSVFHTEIQLEDSNFVTIPNLYIANNYVKITRKSNTVISSSVSLSYDVSRTLIEEALKEAALATGLTDPYVYIVSLGDFSVVYKIHGFLVDSSKFFSTKSLLNAKVMDILHEKNIEIVSPSFMNQRRVDEKEFIPKNIVIEQIYKEDYSPEELVFDEAIKSGEIEKKKDFLSNIEQRQISLKEKLKDLEDEKDIERVKSAIAHNEELKSKIEKNIEEQNRDLEGV